MSAKSTGGALKSKMGCTAAFVVLGLLFAAGPAVAPARAGGDDPPGLATSATPGAPGARVVDLRLDDGTPQRILYVAPVHPRGSIVMLPGGSGDIGIGTDGTLRHGDNFVVRTRQSWVERGYAVVIPDTVDNQNLRGLRHTSRYADIVRDLVRFARSQDGGPIYLLGTSQGSIAAMNGAAHAAQGTLTGVVLTESVSVLGGSRETVFSADPAQVQVPALIVANRDDRCTVSPPDDAPRIAAAMTKAQTVDVTMVNGGANGSERPCGSLSPHGYFGIESTVIAQISDWLDAHRGSEATQ